MNRFTAVVMGALTLLAAGAASAEDKPAAAPAMSAEQQAQMAAFANASTPRAEHKQLEYFAGTWTAKTQFWMDPAAPPQETAGTSKNEMIYGGRYASFGYSGTFWGQPFTGQGLMGFDNLRGKFFNTWIDSMSTSFWVAWGDYDKASNSWTFRGDMPDMMKPTTIVKVRQVFRIHDPKRYTFEWYEMRDGKELKTMLIDYQRQ
ncbi:MAG TPA: DUF1579 domain-containing protein [Tahibacter sp.]|uniref:DUF1579 domain-containing protein n=1 Tax=Tahibacter sp. TaxID=2056211 RepID=UPI002BDF7181|nr:DUF1579 domain-containing protein [Tahibacter sp.]HSX59792.1 DUF1579 domain-containing protein [Tahibacter sp.]